MMSVYKTSFLNRLNLKNRRKINFLIYIFFIVFIMNFNLDVSMAKSVILFNEEQNLNQSFDYCSLLYGKKSDSNTVLRINLQSYNSKNKQKSNSELNENLNSRSIFSQFLNSDEIKFAIFKNEPDGEKLIMQNLLNEVGFDNEKCVVFYDAEIDLKNLFEQLNNDSCLIKLKFYRNEVSDDNYLGFYFDEDCCDKNGWFLLKNLQLPGGKKIWES